ncbi:hypothetical protein SCAR479_03215 [Seiridium cardinale]|uniref:C3H1-type domain-containing protein n=1 Tax=Seiridium cardinale TaxID=138064 RepID=A0ABR2Y1Y4_9PEZI
MSTTSHANAERAMGRTLSGIAMLHGAGEITWEQYQELLRILGRDKDLTPIDTGHIVGGLTSGNLRRLNSSEHGTAPSNLTTGTDSSTPLKSEKLDRRFLLFDLSPLDGARSANTWGDVAGLERHKPVTETPPPVSIPSTGPGPTSASGQQRSNNTDAYLAPAPTNTPLNRNIWGASSGISWDMEPLSASVTPTPTVEHFPETNPLMMTAPLSGCTKSGSNTPARGPEHNHQAYRTNSTADHSKGSQLKQTVQSTTRPMRIGDYSARDDPKRPSRSTKHTSASPFSADEREDRRQWATTESLRKLDVEHGNSGTSSTSTAYSRQAHNWSNPLSAEQAALSTDPTPTSKGKISHPPKLITIIDSCGSQVSYETINSLVAEKYDSDAEDGPQTPYTIDHKGKDKERVRSSRPPGPLTECKVSKDTLVNDGGLSTKEGTAALPSHGFRSITPRREPASTIASRHIPGTTESHQWGFARSIRNPPQRFANFSLPPASTHHLIVCPYWWRSGTCPWKGCPFQHREFDGAIIQRLMCPFWIGMRGPDGCRWRDEDCEFAHLDCIHGQWAHVSNVRKKREEYDN